MKRQLLSAALLIASFAPIHVASAPQAQQILAAAEQQAHIFADQGAPLQLEVDFIAPFDASSHGHLSLRWQSKDRWWSRVVIGDFRQTSLQNGERVYIAQNRPAPIRIRELTRLLHFAHATQQLNVKKVKKGVENGITVSCSQLEWEQVKGESHEICVNPASNEIVSEAWQAAPPDEQNRELFSEYTQFQGHRYPRKLQLEVNGRTVIAAIVDSLKSAPFDEKLLVPPKGAVERRQCAGMNHAVALKMPDPAIPVSPGKDRPKGSTIVSLTVLTDGSVSEVQLVGGGTFDLAEGTRADLKKWKFKPAMCGKEPVVSDVEVVVTSR
jgi:hypothetical protein